MSAHTLSPTVPTSAAIRAWMRERFARLADCERAFFRCSRQPTLNRSSVHKMWREGSVHHETTLERFAAAIEEIDECQLWLVGALPDSPGASDDEAASEPSATPGEPVVEADGDTLADEDDDTPPPAATAVVRPHPGDPSLAIEEDARS